MDCVLVYVIEVGVNFCEKYGVFIFIFVKCVVCLFLWNKVLMLL